MVSFLAANWWWILFLGAMFFMHAGHGGHGGHGGGCGGGHGQQREPGQQHDHGTPGSGRDDAAHRHDPAYPVDLRKPPTR